MSREDPSRTEKATDKRVKKARTEGSVARSNEVSTVCVLLTAVVALRYMIEFYLKNFNEIFNWFFVEGLTQELNQQTVYRMFVWALLKMALLLLPFMCLIGLAAYTNIRWQVGKLWTFKVKWSRINFNIPAALKKLMISPDVLVRLGRSLIQATIVAIAPYIVIKQEMPNLIPLFHQNVLGISSYMLMVAYKMFCYALVPMILMAIADLWWTRYRYNDNLMMTKSEVKDERRQAEATRKWRASCAKCTRSWATQPQCQGRCGHHQPHPLCRALRYDLTEAPAPLVWPRALTVSQRESGLGHRK
jgi:flagellar biosynthetic protein FlhB